MVALVLNPHRLVPALMEHFEEYVVRLRDRQNSALREDFERRWKWLHGGAGRSKPRQLTVVDVP